MKVVVDRDLCESNGVCVATAPEVFAFDSEDRLVIVQPTPDPDLRAKVEDAVDGCPRAALSIVDS